MKQLWKNFDRRMGHKTVEFLVKIWPFNKPNKCVSTNDLKRARQADAEFAKWFVRENRDLAKDELIHKLKLKLNERKELK